MQKLRLPWLLLLYGALLVACDGGSALPRVFGVEIIETDLGMRVGAVAHFHADVHGGTNRAEGVFWGVDDARVASVDAAGDLHALAAGSVTLEAVSAIDPGQRDSRRVSVYALAPAIPEAALPLGVGEAHRDGQPAPLELHLTNAGLLLESSGVRIELVGLAPTGAPVASLASERLQLRAFGLQPGSVPVLELHGPGEGRAHARVDATGGVAFELPLGGVIDPGSYTLLLYAFDAQGSEWSVALGVWVGDPADLPPPPAAPTPDAPTPQPVLSVSERNLVLGGRCVATLDIHNRGEPGSLLQFDVRSLAPWLTVTRLGSGDVEADCSCSISLQLCGTVPVAAGASTTLLITSNAGSANVTVSVGEGVGPSVCAVGNPAAPAASRLAQSAVGTLMGALMVPPPAPLPNDPWTLTREALVVYDEAWVHPASAVERRRLLGALAQRVGATVVREGAPAHHDVWLLGADASAAAAAAAALAAEPAIRYVIPNLPLQRLVVPNDKYYPDQWSARCFGLEAAWQIAHGAGGAEVVVAIVDDGLLVTHPDIAEKVLPGYDFANRQRDVASGDRNWHGTHVAGIAAAVGDNAIGIAGVAFGAGVKVLPVKVFPDAGDNATLADLIDGMRWSVGISVRGAPTNAHPAQVVNLSLGVEIPHPVSSEYASVVAYFDRVVGELRARGALVVAAAGNTGSHATTYPARAKGALGVGSVDYRGLRSSFSNHGLGLDLMAPGGFSPAGVGCFAVVSLYRSGANPGYACAAGTSMASPYVAGVAALLIAENPSAYRNNPDAIEARLKSTALFAPGMLPNLYGAGIVCPDAALGASSRCGWAAPPPGP
jgi:subtilisin family serine protease